VARPPRLSTGSMIFLQQAVATHRRSPQLSIKALDHTTTDRACCRDGLSQRIFPL
jgi:hypothetical protein